VSVSRLARLAVPVALAATLVGGCGSAHPGVAAQVGDDTITVDQVNELAGNVCALEKAVPEGTANKQPPTSGLLARNGAVQSMVLRSMADQMGDDYGVTLDQKDYQAQVDQVRLRFAVVNDDDLVEAALPAYTAIPYFVNIVSQIGETTGDVTGDDALAAGVKQAQKWQQDHPIETNPMFGSFNIGDQEIESERDDLAFPVSTSAKDAEANSGEYVASLPESQRCG
jgi:hypothetical protein